MLQETHFCSSDDIFWRSEWGGEIIFSHGSVSQCGTALLLPRNFNGTIVAIDRDDGRVCSVEVDFEAISISFVCIYAPAVNSQQQKVSF